MHHERGEPEQRHRRIQKGKQHERKDAHIAPKTEAMGFPVPPHPTVVFVRRVAVDERAGEGRKPCIDGRHACHLVHQRMHRERAEQERIGVAVQHGIQPAAIVAFRKLRARDLAVAAVQDACGLRKKPAKRDPGPARLGDEPCGKHGERKRAPGDLHRRGATARKPEAQAG